MINLNFQKLIIIKQAKLNNLELQYVNYIATKLLFFGPQYQCSFSKQVLFYLEEFVMDLRGGHTTPSPIFLYVLEMDGAS